MFDRDETIHTLVRYFLLNDSRNQDCPLEAGESYYARSSHSGWRNNGVGRFLWGWNGKLEKEIKADSGKTAVAILLEKWVVVADATSAIFSAIHADEEPKRWFHDPFWGGYITITDYIGNDGRVCFGWFLTHEMLLADEYIAVIGKEFERIMELYQVALVRESDCRGGYRTTMDPKKKEAYQGELPGLHRLCLETLTRIRTELDRKLTEIPEA